MLVPNTPERNPRSFSMAGFSYCHPEMLTVKIQNEPPPAGCITCSRLHFGPDEKSPRDSPARFLDGTPGCCGSRSKGFIVGDAVGSAGTGGTNLELPTHLGGASWREGLVPSKKGQGEKMGCAQDQVGTRSVPPLV